MDTQRSWRNIVASSQSSTPTSSAPSTPVQHGVALLGLSTSGVSPPNSSIWASSDPTLQRRGWFEDYLKIPINSNMWTFGPSDPGAVRPEEWTVSRFGADPIHATASGRNRIDRLFHVTDKDSRYRWPMQQHYERNGGKVRRRGDPFNRTNFGRIYIRHPTEQQLQRLDRMDGFAHNFLSNIVFMPKRSAARGVSTRHP